MPDQPDFRSAVLAIVRRIPRGRVATYGDVAELAGRPGAARAVGNIMRRFGGGAVPAHRVIAAGGRLGGFGGNEMVKRGLLLSEGVGFAGRRVLLDEFRIKVRPKRLSREPPRRGAIIA